MIFRHPKLSTWYHQLAQSLEAGLPLSAALRNSRGTGAPAHVLERIAQVIESGGTIREALAAADPWMPEADRLFLDAAAHAGRMPRTLHLLSRRHHQLGAASLRVVIGCLYPVAVLHLGLFLLPLARMIDWEKGFTWDTLAYGRGLAFTVIPIWLALGGLVLLARRPGAVVEKITRLVPIVGRYVRIRALSDFCFGLGNLLEAGTPIDRAWTTTGAISRDPDLQAAATGISAIIAQGMPPGPHLADYPCFPPEFVALYRTGESSGQLEINLQRLAADTDAQAQRALTLATVVYPGLMFLAVAVGVGYFVISIYSGYLKMLTQLAAP